jgi:hypothetical protein
MRWRPNDAQAFLVMRWLDPDGLEVTTNPLVQFVPRLEKRISSEVGSILGVIGTGNAEGTKKEFFTRGAQAPINKTLSTFALATFAPDCWLPPTQGARSVKESSELRALHRNV